MADFGEVYGLDLSQTELVILSACQTQIGELSAGDEVVGLTRAFFFAGTPAVIASLWNVDDQATGRLMERFYTHLQAGQSQAAALRQAQLELLQAEEYADPFYWSAFVLSGNGGETNRGIPERASSRSPAQEESSQADSSLPPAQPQRQQKAAVSVLSSSWSWLIVGLGLMIVIAGVVWVAWRRRSTAG